MKYLFPVCASVWIAVTGVSVSVAAESQPNIILILADDMGVGEVSHHGGLIPTPALDQMASEGMRFTDAHTSSSVCTPTRYGILTGRYNWRSRLKRGVLTNVDSAALMDPDRVNLGNYLQDAGYHTACVGKWHLGADWVSLPPDQIKAPALTEAENKRPKTFNSWKVDYTKPFRNGPTDVGFDQAFFILSSLDMPPYLYMRNDRAESVPTVNRSFPHNEYNDYFRVGAGAEDFDASTCLADFARESRNYIKERSTGESKKDPFLLYLALNSPHTPVVPGEKFKGKYPQYSWYADFVAETDWVVGEVLTQLEESGVDENTLVIFTADNGFAPYVEIPKMLAAGYRPSGDLRGAKATIFEGGHRVPFLVRWPQEVAGGTVCDSTICTTDFFATFADVVDQDGGASTLPDSVAEDSFSFYPCLQGEQGETRPFTIHHDIGGRFAIRKGPWKLILSNSAGGGWGSKASVKTPARLVQLYQLDQDPGETRNLEETHPEKIEELVGELAKAFRDGRTTTGAPQTNEGWPFQDKKLLQAFPQLAEKPASAD